MKSIQLIQKPQLRGAEVFASQLSTHLTSLGHETIIVSVFPGVAELPFSGKKFSIDGSPRKRFYDFESWRKLAVIIKDEKPDIIQANAGDTLKYAVFSKLIFGWKQPIVFRNASTISLYIKSFWSKKLSGFFFSFTQKIISVSRNSAADFERLYPKFANKILPITIGIENDALVPNVQAGIQLNKRSNHVETGPLFIHVGGFTFEKNHTELISIFQLILKSVPTARLQLVGDGPLKKDIESIVVQNGIDRQVKMPGFQTNVMSLITKADVLLLPSIIEGLPAVILEAFFCHTPVVAYNVGGINEILINGKTGRLIEKGDIGGFANAALDALKSNDNNKLLIENAYNLVTSHYLNKQIAARFLKVYKSLIFN